MLKLSEIFAGAYRGSPKEFLVHAVTRDGKAVCGRVKKEHLMDWAQPKHLRPTCKKCANAWDRDIEVLTELVRKGKRVVDDFSANLSNCALQNYEELNEFLIEANAFGPSEAARTGA